MTKQPNTRSFSAGDRIIYNGQFIGTLISPSGHVEGLHWKVEWEDGAETDTVYPQAMMVHANGGPGSARRAVSTERLRRRLTEYQTMLQEQSAENEVFGYHATGIGIALRILDEETS